MNAAKIPILMAVLLALAAMPGAATPLAGPCVPGAAYDPACDVDHDSDVDIFDIQLTAGHWSQSGPWVSDNNHTHLGQTWTGSNGSPLRLGGSYGAPDYAPLVLSSTNGAGLRIATTGGEGVYVNSAGGSGVFVNSTGANGVYVGTTGTNGIFVNQADDDGVYVYSAGGDGIYVGTATWDGVRVGTAGGDGVEVTDAQNNGVFVNSTGGDGVAVYAAGSPGTITSSVDKNGFEVAGAEANGLYVGWAGAHGVSVNQTFGSGVYVNSAGYHGVEVNHTYADGVHVGSAGADGVHVTYATDFGVYVNTAGQSGVEVYSAANDGVSVRTAGSPSSFYSSDAQNGFEVAGAQGNGLFVGRADGDGAHIVSAGDDGVQIGDNTSFPSYGLYVPPPGTSSITLWPNTANASGQWALYTTDNIDAGNVLMGSQSLLAVVGGDDALSPGDVVAAAGLADPLPGSQPRLPQVRLATTEVANVVGVVSGRMALRPAPGKEGVEILLSAEGPAQPGDYVAITVLGLAQVKVDGAAPVAAGQRLTVAATPGRARTLRSVEVEGITLDERGPTVGVALDAARDGLVWVLVNPQ